MVGLLLHLLIIKSPLSHLMLLFLSRPHHISFSVSTYLSPPLLLLSLRPHSAQVDRCLAARPVIITAELDVSGGFCWRLFEDLTDRTGQDRTLPVGTSEGRINEDIVRTAERRSFSEWSQE